jgi:Effector protein
MTEYFQCPNIRVDADELLKPSTAMPSFIQNDLKTAAPAYERDTVNLLEQLRNTWTAWAVIAAISAIGKQNGRKMTIKPFNKFDKDFNLDQNAYAAPVNGTAATPRGKPMEACSADPNTGVKAGQVLTDPQGKPYIGTGAGSDTEIRYNALMWTQPADSTGPARPGVDADEILLHEMIHGLRQMRGQSQCSGTWDNPGYDTREEFVAILVSNLYRSEKLRSGLRSDHHGFAQLSPAMSDANTFLTTGNNTDYIHNMFEEDLVFSKNLAKVQCRFNPVKLFYERYGRMFGR